MLFMDIGSVVLWFEIIGKNYACAIFGGLAQYAQFLAALGDKLIFFVVGCGCVVMDVVRHEGPPAKRRWLKPKPSILGFCAWCR